MNRLLMLAAMTALVALPAHAEPYTLFIYESQEQLELRPANTAAAEAYWAAYDTFGKDLAAAGVLRGGSALSTGAPLSLVAGGAVADAAAPYAVSPLSLGGYFQIDVTSDAEAIEWAAKMPVIGGVVEVRAGYPVPGMAM